MIRSFLQEESYYVGRVGISDKDSEPVVIELAGSGGIHLLREQYGTLSV